MSFTLPVTLKLLVCFIIPILMYLVTRTIIQIARVFPPLKLNDLFVTQRDKIYKTL